MPSSVEDAAARYPIRVDRLFRPLFTLLGAGPRRDVIEIRAASVVVRFGWLLRSDIARSAIARAHHHRNSHLAWGVHGWWGRWLVNGSSKGIVQLDLEPRQRAWLLGIWRLRVRTLLVSLVDPDGFLAELGAPADAHDESPR